jgi:hypothetical protein
VTALADVVDALRRGRVQELLFDTTARMDGSTLREARLWIGPEPLELAVTQEELESMGAQGGAGLVPADVALVRAAVAQDAGLTFVEDGAVELMDGVGAVLRWSDGSTPSVSVPSQSADTGRLRGAV